MQQYRRTAALLRAHICSVAHWQDPAPGEGKRIKVARIFDPYLRPCPLPGDAGVQLREELIATGHPPDLTSVASGVITVWRLQCK